eukprot:10511170-Ditylum_brightwellii.AAC.1
MEYSRHYWIQRAWSHHGSGTFLAGVTKNIAKVWVSHSLVAHFDTSWLSLPNGSMVADVRQGSRQRVILGKVNDTLKLLQVCIITAIVQPNLGVAVTFKEMITKDINPLTTFTALASAHDGHSQMVAKCNVEMVGREAI